MQREMTGDRHRLKHWGEQGSETSIFILANALSKLCPNLTLFVCPSCKQICPIPAYTRDTNEARRPLQHRVGEAKLVRRIDEQIYGLIQPFVLETRSPVPPSTGFNRPPDRTQRRFRFWATRRCLFDFKERLRDSVNFSRHSLLFLPSEVSWSSCLYSSKEKYPPKVSRYRTKIRFK